jgi:hypothetical protein
MTTIIRSGRRVASQDTKTASLEPGSPPIRNSAPRTGIRSSNL